MNRNVDSFDGDTIHSFIHSLPPVQSLFYTRAIRGGRANPRVGCGRGCRLELEKSQSIAEIEPKPKRKWST